MNRALRPAALRAVPPDRRPVDWLCVATWVGLALIDLGIGSLLVWWLRDLTGAGLR